MQAKFLALITSFAAIAAAVDPAAIYIGTGKFNAPNAPVGLRIGNGGVGQSGLVKALSDAFINEYYRTTKKAIKIAWYKSDTTYSINYLKSDTVDVALTYSPVAERITIAQGVAKSPSYYAFRDHFILVGPKSNPAKLDGKKDIQTIFAKLHEAAEKGDTSLPVRFLSRYDKSATNIKDSELFLSIGQVPWATAYSTWYHQYIAFPIQALTAAIRLQEYTITDRGIFLSLDEKLQQLTNIIKAFLGRRDRSVAQSLPFTHWKQDAKR